MVSAERSGPPRPSPDSSLGPDGSLEPDGNLGPEVSLSAGGEREIKRARERVRATEGDRWEMKYKYKKIHVLVK